MINIAVRNYEESDYSQVKKLYEDSGWFDKVTDSEAHLTSKIKKDPDSILVAIFDEKIVGTVSLIEDGRIAILFRLVSVIEDGKEIRSRLISNAIDIFKQKGFSEVHIIALEEDRERQKEYKASGFSMGKQYRWMWKKIE